MIDDISRDSQGIEPALFAERLKAQRVAMSMTQQQLADASGINRAMIGHLEQGRVANPTLETIVKLAKNLKCLPEELTGDTRIRDRLEGLSSGDHRHYVPGPVKPAQPEPRQPILARTAPLPPSKAKHVRQADAKLRQALLDLANVLQEVAQLADNSRALQAIAKVQTQVAGAQQELDRAMND